jgi:hypothetical protein
VLVIHLRRFQQVIEEELPDASVSPSLQFLSTTTLNLPNSCKHDAAKIDDIEALSEESYKTLRTLVLFFSLLQLVISERLAHERGRECHTGGLDITTRWLNVINFVFTPRRPYLFELWIHCTLKIC